jgi:hypothetical protein
VGVRKGKNKKQRKQERNHGMGTKNYESNKFRKKLRKNRKETGQKKLRNKQHQERKGIKK